jgi:molybdenum cofactor cytidylyltransferase
MAGPKVTAPLGGGTVVGHVVSAVRSAGGLREIVVVAGSGYADVAAAVAQAETAASSRRGPADPAAPIRVVRNPTPEEGMSSTLRVGLGVLRRPAGVMVLLGDQPLVHPETLRRILEVSGESPRMAAVGLSGNGASHVRPPVLLHRSLLPFVMGLRGDQGARNLLAAHATSVLSVEGAPEEAVDVDRPEDLERVRRIVAASVNPEDRDDDPA